MIDIRRNDGAAARDFLAHEFGRDEFGNGGAKALAVGDALLGDIERALAAEVLAMRDIDHFFRNDPGAGELKLSDGLRAGRPMKPALGRAWRHETLAFGEAIVFGLDAAALVGFETSARREPGTRRGQSRRKVGREGCAGIGS